MIVFPQTMLAEPAENQAVKERILTEPAGMWPQLSSNQQVRLSQIISQMVRRWQTAQVEEVKHDGDVD